jgi:hypothetical protein
MTGLRRVAWVVPLALGALTLTLLAALVVARQETASRALSLGASAIVNGGQGTPPEIAALDAQLAQINALRAGATYGSGLIHVVRGPVPTLRPVLGEEWRELGGSVGRVLLRPTGARSRYFEVSVVAVAPQGPARLSILTSEGQQVTETVGAAPFQVVNFGPLLTPDHGPVLLAFSSIQPRTGSPGPSLILSPLQAQYLAPGEWVTGMPALAAVGPGGLRGVYLGGGSTTRFAITPGARGRGNVTLDGASAGGATQVSVRMGSEVRSARVATSPTVVHLGPFSHANGVLSVSVVTLPGGSKGSVFISDMRFVAGPP